MRLNAYLARAGVASRRGADEVIKAGRVEINGQPGQLNSRVEVNDVVKVDGKAIESQMLRYILFYKPARTITTLKDPEDRPTILDDVKIPQRVIPVGRLDFDTTGALLLTNDGDLAHKLMHPSFEVDKVYEAEVEGEITDDKLQKLEQGIELKDGKTAPAKARRLEGQSLLQGLSLRTVEITIHEGRNHQVKRMLEAVGLPVKKLHRSKYGTLDLTGLKPAKWRDLTDQEVSRLKQG
jgi:23S rRNA pseudouridine2605 synthase